MEEQNKAVWSKGGPSPNPRGRGARKLSAAKGTDGVSAPMGFLYDVGERNRALIGPERWTTYDNLLVLLPGLAAAVRAWLLLASSVKWRAQDNPRGGEEAKRCTLLVQEGLLDARMPVPWRTGVVPRHLYGTAALGFSIHAKGTRRDDAGRIVFSEIGHRPQWSIYRWIKPSETSTWDAIEQRSRIGTSFLIERSDLFYSVNRDLSDSPDGVGLFRHVVEGERFRTRFRQLLGIAFDTDVNGIPVGRAPLAKLSRIATMSIAEGGGGIDPADSAAVLAFVDRYTGGLRDLLTNRVVTPNRALMLDSQTYVATKADKSEIPTAVYEWNVETIKSIIGSIPEMRAEIRELDREALRLFFAEWMMMGDGTGATRASHTDKTSMMGFAIDGWLDRITVDAERDLVWPLVTMNGYDAERCAPSLSHEPVATQGALEAAQMLEALTAAALDADDEAVDVVRARAELPPRPKVKTAPSPSKPKPAPSEDNITPGQE